MEELKKYDNVTGLEIDDCIIEFYLNINFFGTKRVCLNFENYDISIESEKKEILFLTDYVLDEFSELSENIFHEIKQYAKKEYNKNISKRDFIEGDIEIMVISFDSDWTRGVFCIQFHSTFEEEHGIGVVIKDNKIQAIGYADICFQSDL